MCLPIDCWLCMPRTVDDDPAPARRTQHAQRNGGSHYAGNGGHHSNGNGGHYYNGNGYQAHRPVAEADRKASNDARRGPHAHATGAQEKAAYPYAGADETTLKQQQPAAAWNGRVAAADGHGARGGAQHTYSSYEHAQLPAHREDAAADYHYMATADHGSPTEALGRE